MDVVLAAPARLDADSGRVSDSRLPRWFADAHGWIAAAIYLLVIVLYQHYPLLHLTTVCSCSDSDPTQWMWLWKWLPYALLHGDNPLLTTKLWAGQTYNLAAGTLAPASAIPGAPLSALFGPIAAYNLLMLAAPVVNGWAAYRLCRYVSGAPWASILAGYTYGFSAYELGHQLGHVHLVFVFVPPMLIHLVLRYLDGGVSRRRMTITAFILLLVEFGLSTEILFAMTYLGAVALVVAYVCVPARRRALREVAGLLAIAYVAVVAVCSYYIYLALTGPAESSGESSVIQADLLSYVFPTPAFKLWGHAFLSLSSTFVTNNPAEQNNYLGLPLFCVVIAFLVRGWRSATTKIIGVTTCVAFVLSLGVTLIVAGHPTIWLPFSLLDKLPVFKLEIPSRLGVFVALGAALAAAQWLSWAQTRTSTIWRWLVALAAVAFLIPNPSTPGRLQTYDQPSFFTTDLYRHYLTRNEVVMTIPFSASGDEMLWQADTDMYFRLAGGYFGFPPPWDDGIGLVYYQLFPGSGPLTVAQGVREITSFVALRHVGAVVVQPNDAQDWPAVLAAAHFRLRASVGGVEVYAPAA